MNTTLKNELQFEFGKNWTAFLSTVGEYQIAEAKKSLTSMLGIDSLAGVNFLDIGCGSGLFSLAAVMLGATNVYSFDYDQQSVNCTREIKRRFIPDAQNWTIEGGSVLDDEYLHSLGVYDVVYSWGVLHHTGNMWQALGNAAIPVKKGGKLFLSIYNDQGWISLWWKRIKHIYNILPSPFRILILIPVLVKNWGWKILRDFLLLKPLYTWRTYAAQRGMSPWYDVVDWAGGYPFEVAKPDQIFDFYHSRGFELERLKTAGGGGQCNEYVFRRR